MSEEDLINLVEGNASANDNQFMDNIVIVGGGTMGRGITIVAAKRGIEVLLIEKNETSLAQSLDLIKESLDKEISRWSMTESEKKAILSRIKGVVEFSEITSQQLIIEALNEDFELKKAVFKELDKYCQDKAILITNTSTLSITELASVTGRPDKVIGMHFLSPVQKIKLIEVVKGLNTSADTFQKVMAFAKKLERTPIEVFESPGYVTTRVFIPLVNEAIQVLMEGIASAEDIDTAIRIGYEIPTGPLAMADSIGLDQVLKWMETLFHDLGDAKYRPCPLLRMLVRAGHLGVKTSQGFFKYNENGEIITGSGRNSNNIK
ncbi:3-hydroxybutyryl-CoA dehydrogenase [bacterium]|nr:3-hydroxybutyryl-CoA dehydrogenase [bacterium]